MKLLRFDACLTIRQTSLCRDSVSGGVSGMFGLVPFRRNRIPPPPSHKREPNMKSPVAISLLSALLLAFASAISAAEEQDDGWQFITTPFIWGSGLEGDLTVHGLKTH